MVVVPSSTCLPILFVMTLQQPSSANEIFRNTHTVIVITGRQAYYYQMSSEILTIILKYH